MRGALTCRRLAAIVVALVLVLPTGCGGRHQPPPTLAKQAVMHAFRAATGIEPNVAVSSTRLGYVLDGDFAAPTELHTYQKLFGSFSLYVAGPAGSGTISRMLSGASPDADGIGWRRMNSQGATVWIAIKRYGANLVLSWVTPNDVRAVDGRWNRLDQMLRAVAARASADRPRGA